jgi:hypothetical protein
MICHDNLPSNFNRQTSFHDLSENVSISTKSCYKFFVVLLCLYMTGCSTFKSSDVKVSPAEFVHPDEIVRGEGFMVLADRRLFTVMAFINAVGYDSEWEGTQMHPVRIRVRKEIQSRLAKESIKKSQWQKYYEQRKLDIYHYADYALSLSSDYPFRRIRPDSELGYPEAQRRLDGFPEVLNDFWATVRLEEVWDEIKPEYVAEINKYDFKEMSRQLSFLWEYLRMERDKSYVIVNVPNLMGQHYQGFSVQYEKYIYTIENPGSHSYGLNIHEYLHKIVGPLIDVHYEQYKDKLRNYYEAGRDGDWVVNYKHPRIFTEECLVRALDNRIKMKMKEKASGQMQAEPDMVAQETDKGFNLVRPFYQLMSRFEESNESFENFLPVMLETLQEYGQ